MLIGPFGKIGASRAKAVKTKGSNRFEEMPKAIAANRRLVGSAAWPWSRSTSCQIANGNIAANKQFDLDQLWEGTFVQKRASHSIARCLNLGKPR